jgi:hypothetical protein
LVVFRGAIGLCGVGILVLALRPVALFLGEERWVDLDVNDGSSYSVNEELYGVAGHWAYPTLVVVTVPAGVNDAVVRRGLAVSRDVLPGSGLGLVRIRDGRCISSTAGRTETAWQRGEGVVTRVPCGVG